MDNSGRFARQEALVPQDVLVPLQVTIIGIGAIGRQVALQLAALGVRQLQFVDFDKVDPTNVTTQGYLQADLELTKVAATARAVRQIDPTLELTLVEDRFRPQAANGRRRRCLLLRGFDYGPVRCLAQCGPPLPLLDRWPDARGGHANLDGRSGPRLHALPDDPLSTVRSTSGSLHGPGNDLHGRHRRRPDGSPVHPLAAQATGGRGPVSQSVGERTDRRLIHLALQGEKASLVSRLGTSA
jgi:hypothetical protein